MTKLGELVAITNTPADICLHTAENRSVQSERDGNYGGNMFFLPLSENKDVFLLHIFSNAFYTSISKYLGLFLYHKNYNEIIICSCTKCLVSVSQIAKSNYGTCTCIVSILLSRTIKAFFVQHTLHLHAATSNYHKSP